MIPTSHEELSHTAVWKHNFQALLVLLPSLLLFSALWQLEDVLFWCGSRPTSEYPCRWYLPIPLPCIGVLIRWKMWIASKCGQIISAFFHLVVIRNGKAMKELRSDSYLHFMRCYTLTFHGTYSHTNRTFGSSSLWNHRCRISKGRNEDEMHIL